MRSRDSDRVDGIKISGREGEDNKKRATQVIFSIALYDTSTGDGPTTGPGRGGRLGCPTRGVALEEASSR